MSRNIAVIGTAGRDKTHPLHEKHWVFMANTVYEEVGRDDMLISGGAAWADHVAVWAFMNDLCKGLVLHLPAPFEGGKFIGEYGTSGNACNYYHRLFSKEMGFNSRGHLMAAIEKGAIVTYQPHMLGYAAMSARNLLVASDCTHMMAFTMGIGDVPTDGGTKITWDMAAAKDRVHLSLAGL